VAGCCLLLARFPIVAGGGAARLRCGGYDVRSQNAALKTRPFLFFHGKYPLHFQAYTYELHYDIVYTLVAVRHADYSRGRAVFESYKDVTHSRYSN